ncbi:uncharacterized protein LOC119031252 isoform X2 [Acanthopagrus latus]|uniref:uncharacterized protein LOC119031252 isoform X2 n=1 Tax=Acanthopagrus latus TaxID=8177 RepID=UPI00187CB7A1|nr:uncharacterized protein LOC119031252 isoform X2 [Acanthopagrus latus]
MSDTAEKEWKPTLTEVLEDLDNIQYRKTMEYLDKIPRSQKKGRSEAMMAQKIIEYYGHDESILKIRDIMKEIPRNDPKIQGLLGPFVKKLRNKTGKGKKRKCDPVKKEDNRPAVYVLCSGKKRKCDPVKEETKPAEDQKSSQPVKETNTDRWKSIRELKSSSALLDTDIIVGKVVEKSGVRTYKTKENVKKYFFYLAVADETASIKLMVYGKPLYKEFMEEKTYMFRRLMKDENGFVKFSSQSKSSQTKPVQVPDKLQAEARELIYPNSPDYSIADAKLSAVSRVTVKGTITQIDPIEPAAGKKKQKTQRFKIRDDSDSINICMWGEDTKQCTGLSVGDVVQAANMKTNWYRDIISLNSTGFTKIQKVQSAGSQSERIKIAGIAKATKTETHLDAVFRDEMQRCVVASRLLAKAFGFDLDGDIEKKLLDIIPVSADAVIQGGKIKKLTAAPVK